MASKTKYIEGVTERGVMQYPHLNKPDTKFDKVTFKVNLVLPDNGDKTIELVRKVDDMLAALGRADAEVLEMLDDDSRKRLIAAVKSKKAKPSDPQVAPQVDDEGNETGNIVVKFKKNGQYKDKKSGQMVPMALTLVDAKKNPVKDSVWSGSEGKVSYALMPWVNVKNEYGVKMAMNAVQVLSLKSSGGSSGSEFDDEDGYESGDGAPEAASGSSHEAGAGVAADEF